MELTLNSIDFAENRPLDGYSSCGELYFADGESVISASEADAALTEEQRELLALRSAVVYDAFFGKNYITAAMNEAPGT